MRYDKTLLCRMLPAIVAAVVAAGAVGDGPSPHRGIVKIATPAGAAAVSGRAAKGGSVSSKAKPGGSVNGGKR